MRAIDRLNMERSLHAPFLVTGHEGARRFVVYHGWDEAEAYRLLREPFELKRKRIKGQHRMVRKLWTLKSRAKE